MPPATSWADDYYSDLLHKPHVHLYEDNYQQVSSFMDWYETNALFAYAV